MVKFSVLEMYRTDRSNVFSGNDIKLLSKFSTPNRESMQDILMKYKTIDNYNFSKFIEMINKIGVYDLKYINRITHKFLHQKYVGFYKVLFSIDQEDLSWGGITPPILRNRYDITFYPLLDEYYLISVVIEIIHNNSNITYRSGSVLVDGDDNLEKAINLIVENYDKIS